jgi:hypothetical protein
MSHNDDDNIEIFGYDIMTNTFIYPSTDYGERLVEFQNKLDYATVDALLNVIDQETPTHCDCCDRQFASSLAKASYQEYREMVKKPFQESLVAAMDLIDARSKRNGDRPLEHKRASRLIRKLYALTSCIEHTENKIKWIEENNSLLK